MSEKSGLIAYRLQQAEETMQTARLLLRNSHDMPSIANRTYYACFYGLLALLVDKEIGTSKHYGVISAFDREFVRAGLFAKEDSKTVHEAFDIRQEYDYQEFVSYDAATIEHLLDRVEALIRKIKAFLINAVEKA